METAVFLGAGASKPFGYPVTSEILPILMERWYEVGSLFEGYNGPTNDAADRRDLQTYLLKLLPGLSRTRREHLPLITDVFSLVDSAILNNAATILCMSSNEMRRFHDLLKQAIYDILSQPRKSKSTDNDAHERLGGTFRQWLQSLCPVTIVSTNYDIVLERVMRGDLEDDPWQEKAVGIDFGFDWRCPYEGTIVRRPMTPQMSIFKLHGSLNFLRCPLCNQTYINVYGPAAFNAFKREMEDDNTCHCGHFKLQTQIVAPSLVREALGVSLAECWKYALENLRTASHWIIIGYSFPSEDIAIRELFIRAYQARQEPPDVTVVQHTNESEHRYRLLFPECDFLVGGLEKYLEEQTRLLNVSSST